MLAIRTVGIVASLLLLTACPSPQEQQERMTRQSNLDHEECVSLGFQPGSNAYGDCRLRLKEMRVQANRPVYTPSVGVGYGYHRHHW